MKKGYLGRFRLFVSYQEQYKPMNKHYKLANLKQSKIYKAEPFQH